MHPNNNFEAPEEPEDLSESIAQNETARRAKTYSEQTHEEIIRACACVIADVALSLIESDPHQYSKRPCKTCAAISTNLGEAIRMSETRGTVDLNDSIKALFERHPWPWASYQESEADQGLCDKNLDNIAYMNYDIAEGVLEIVRQWREMHTHYDAIVKALHYIGGSLSQSPTGEVPPIVIHDLVDKYNETKGLLP